MTGEVRMSEKSGAEQDGTWRVELFGGLRVRRNGQVVERFATKKAAYLLAFLALETVPTDRDTIATRLWPDADSYQGRERLRQVLAALRRELAPLGPVPLSGEGRSTLQLEPTVQTDLREFDAAFRAARRSTTDGERLTHLRTAISLANAPLLPEMDDSKVDAERERVSSELVRLVRQSVMLLEARGEMDAALDVAYQGLTADPSREESVQILVELLTRAGQPEAARRQYERLEEVLGVPPTFKLPEPKEFSLPATATAPQRRQPRIPTALTPLFGRENETTAVARLISERHSRLLTLIGPGGVGKTRLALEVGKRVTAAFEGAVWFAPLVSVLRAEGIFPAIASAVEGTDFTNFDAVDVITQRLSEPPHALLILDNMEQIADDGGPMVRELLERLPNLSLLCTSRQPLGIRGEMRFEVQPLALPYDDIDAMTSPAVQYFVHQAQASSYNFRVTEENAMAVIRICRRLDGLPLALELAASWAPTLTAEQIADRLADPLDLLVRRQKDGEARHSTLRSTVETSYRLMTPELQDAFGMLSIFRGGWSLEAAEAVLGMSGAVLLAELRDRSLISAVEVRDGEGSVMRYQLLETLREFAEETAPAELKEVAALRHSAYFAELTRIECENFLRFSRDTRPIRILETEFANISATAEFCLERSEPEVFKRVLDMITSLRDTWTRRSIAFLSPWAVRVRERLDEVPDEIRGHALTAASLVADSQEAADLLEQVIAWHEARGFEVEAANAMYYLAHNLWRLDRQEEALKVVRASAERHARAGSSNGQRVAQASEAGFLRDMNRWDEAVAIWSVLVESAKRLEDEHTVAKIGLDLAMVSIMKQEVDRALALVLEALTIFERRGEQWNIASSYRILARVREAQGYEDAILQCLQKASEIWREWGYPENAEEVEEERNRVLAGKPIGWY